MRALVRGLTTLPAALLLLAVLLAGCAPAGAAPIAYGEASCGFCRMAITDPRFGAELVTAKGRVYAFDSVECLAAFALAQAGTPRGAWVSDYDRPGELVSVDSADFHRLAGAAGSPMGKGLAATRRGEPPPAASATGATMTWRDVLTLVQRDGVDGEARHAH
jgi:copper chaperone NosL